MRFLHWFNLLALLALLSACAGTANFKESQKSAGYVGSIDKDLLIIFETSHLTKAASGNQQLSMIAANAVLKKLSETLADVSIKTSDEVIDSTFDRSEFARALLKHNTKKQVLLIQANSFVQMQQTQYGRPIGQPFWSGEVTWTLRLLDRDRATNPDGKAVWTANTDKVQFGPRACLNDKYQVCGDRFASAIVYQLKADGLIGKK